MALYRPGAVLVNTDQAGKSTTFMRERRCIRLLEFRNFGSTAVFPFLELYSRKKKDSRF